MTQPQPPQGPPIANAPMFVIPCPTNVHVSSERTADGQLVVNLTIMRPMSTNVIVISADDARQLANQIMEAATGIEVAPAGPLFVDDILGKKRP